LNRPFDKNGLQELEPLKRFKKTLSSNRIPFLRNSGEELNPAGMIPESKRIGEQLNMIPNRVNFLVNFLVDKAFGVLL
jgi:hypothetical protein